MVATTEHIPRLVFSIEESCEALGISRTLGYQLARSGELPTVRLGRRLVVPRAALEQMLSSGTTADLADAPKSPTR